ncbi:hypothetical protein DPMN_122986 [Dreissena polymorpha]|uniref:Uncharacterized protein n=1 Tax=Dreissena polymorpha TaxID=45954 RepID=A0A9D4JSH2_DREPO|nr:hypothetical protein DPMN_122986 [Dreissena polymorpha]
MIFGQVSRDYAGKIYFLERLGQFQPTDCPMDLVTDRDYVIAYKFENLNLNNLCAKGNEQCGCNNSVLVSNFHDGVNVTKEVCSAENANTVSYSYSIGDKLVFRVKMSPNAWISFQISMFTLQYVQINGCGNDEVLCSSMYVHRTLACGPEKYYCNSQDDECSDTKSSKTNGGLIDALLGGLIVVIFVAIFLINCLRAHNSIHFGNRGVAPRS